MSASVYPSLPSATSIRLFHLAPGTLHEPIVGSLEVVDLEKQPNYECVSYTWGDASDEEEIFVDTERVLIRRHLWEALRRMRLPAQARVLWIDALCISQSDLDEKAQQVHMIGKIVHHASRVLAWLGEHADGSEAIFQGWSAPEEIATDTPLDSIPLELWVRRLNIWLAFCSRRWFSRTWIIQEVVMAKKILVFCGHDVGDWTTLLEDLCPESYVCLDSYGHIHDDVKGMSSFDFAATVAAFLPKDLLACFNLKFGFLKALVDTRRQYRDWIPDLGESIRLPFELFSGNAIASKCLDRRDKIYALRSIIYGPHAEPGHGIPVDYTIDAVELMFRSLHSGIFHNVLPYLARNLVQLLELSDDEVEAVVDIIACQPALLNTSRLTVLAYVCITDARTPAEVTFKLFGVTGPYERIFKDIWKPGWTEKLLRWHAVRKAGGDMYSLLEEASTSDP